MNPKDQRLYSLVFFFTITSISTFKTIFFMDIEIGLTVVYDRDRIVRFLQRMGECQCL